VGLTDLKDEKKNRDGIEIGPSVGPEGGENDTGNAGEDEHMHEGSNCSARIIKKAHIDMQAVKTI
jgi:hypothetical protein